MENAEKKKTDQPVTAVVEQTRPLKLIEKFAVTMGGIEPDKLVTILKNTAFRLPDKNYGGEWHPQEVTNEQMGALLVVAHSYGLNPFLKEIYAFPDKGGIVPIVGVDGWSRMINNHDQFDGMKFEFGKLDVDIDEHAKRCPQSCTCIIFRKDRSHATEVTEYLDEVYRPPFKKNGEVKTGPWQSHTKRMLRHKAMIQCARLAFGFTGIHDQDEAERIVEGEFIPASDTPTKPQTLTDRFGGGEPAVEGEVITKEQADAPDFGEEQEPEKKPESKPEPQKKAKTTAKKAAPKPTPEANYLNRLLAAEDEAQVNDVLTEVAEDEALSQAKRVVIKKAAKAKVRELTAPPTSEE